MVIRDTRWGKGSDHTLWRHISCDNYILETIWHPIILLIMFGNFTSRQTYVQSNPCSGSNKSRKNNSQNSSLLIWDWTLSTYFTHSFMGCKINDLFLWISVVIEQMLKDVQIVPLTSGYQLSNQHLVSMADI